jgi:hypothetical protein
MALKKIIFLILLIISSVLKANRYSMLPFSSGPGPLFSFGLNVQPKKTLVYRQIYTTTEHDLTTQLVQHNHAYYGLSDHFTLVCKQPVLLKRRVNGVHARGLGNFRIEIETIPYVYEIPDEFRFRITTVTGIIPPTATVKQITQQTLHSTSYFIYATQTNTTQKYFQYAGLGAFIPTTHKGFYFGARFYYDIGLCRAIINTSKFFLGFSFEVSGEYQQPRSQDGVTNFATGSNLIFYGPTIRVSTAHFIGQIGIQYPWVMHLKRPSNDPTNYRFAVAGAFRYAF